MRKRAEGELWRLVGGHEKNTFWRQAEGDSAAIAPTGDQILDPVAIIGFTGNAVHQVAPLGDEPTISFNLYGVTDKPSRYKYEPDTLTASPF